MIIICPKCQKKGQVNGGNELAGKKIRCSGCSEMFTITAEPQVLEPELIMQDITKSTPSTSASSSPHTAKVKTSKVAIVGWIVGILIVLAIIGHFGEKSNSSQKAGEKSNSSQKADESKIKLLKTGWVEQDTKGTLGAYVLLKAGDTTEIVRTNLGEPDRTQSMVEDTVIGKSGQEIWYYGKYQLIFTYVVGGNGAQQGVGYLTQVNKY